MFFSVPPFLFPRGPAFLNESDDQIAQRIAEDFPSFGAPTLETVAQLRHQRTSRATTVRAKEYHDVVPLLFFWKGTEWKRTVYFWKFGLCKLDENGFVSILCGGDEILCFCSCCKY